MATRSRGVKVRRGHPRQCHSELFLTYTAETNVNLIHRALQAQGEGYNDGDGDITFPKPNPSDGSVSSKSPEPYSSPAITNPTSLPYRPTIEQFSSESIFSTGYQLDHSLEPSGHDLGLLPFGTDTRGFVLGSSHGSAQNPAQDLHSSARSEAGLSTGIGSSRFFGDDPLDKRLIGLPAAQHLFDGYVHRLECR